MLTKGELMELIIGGFSIVVISYFGIQLVINVIKHKSSGDGAPPSIAGRTIISSPSFFDSFSATVEYPLESWVNSKVVGADGKEGRLEVVLEKNSVLEHKENKNCHLDVVDSVLKVVGNQDVYLAGVGNRLEVLNNLGGVIAGDGNSGEISENRVFRLQLNEMKDIKIIGNTKAKIQSNGGRIIAENNTNLIISGNDHNLEVVRTKNLRIRKSNGKNRKRITVKLATPVAYVDSKIQPKSEYLQNMQTLQRVLEERWLEIDSFRSSSVESGTVIEVEYENSASINGNSFAIGEFAFTLTPVDDDNLDIVLLKFDQNITTYLTTEYGIDIEIEGSDEVLRVSGPKVKISKKNPSEIRIIL